MGGTAQTGPGRPSPRVSGSGASAPGVIARASLFARLDAAPPGSVILVAAPAGSGKSVLLRSWVAAAHPPGVAWVQVERDERDHQRFWLEVATELRSVAGGAAARDDLTPTPDFSGNAFVQRLRLELAEPGEPLLLVVDDLHELTSAEARTELEGFLAELPPRLRVVLATRRDPQLGLHRLRLVGRLTELRAADLRFSLDETRELLAGAGIRLSDESAVRLHARTEGWAAGLRLAALSLAGHPEPEAFVAAFSGSERTVADYLLAEVLERQTPAMRSLLLRTSILDRVNGPLADRLLGTSASERLLLELEAANAFVTAMDPERTWFRYHQLFAELLRLELRRIEGAAVSGLHRAAAAWFAEHGYIVDAITHSLDAEDWPTAIRLVGDHAFTLALDGRGEAVDAMLQRFPQDAFADPQLAVFAAYRELTQRSLDRAAAAIRVAERDATQVAPERRHRLELTLAVSRLILARRRGDLETVLREVGPLLSPVDAATLGDVVAGADARATALVNLGIVELWAARFRDAERHLGEGLELARQIDRPLLEIACLANLALLAASRSLATARRLALEAVAEAESRGWAADPIAAVAYATLASLEAAQGRAADARDWLDRAERTLRPHVEPATALLVHFVRGETLVVEGRIAEALAEFRSAEHLQEVLATRNALTGAARLSITLAQLRLGDRAAARQTVGEVGGDGAFGEEPLALAALQLAEGRPADALEALAPVTAGELRVVRVGTVVQARLLAAAARDRLGDLAGAEDDVEAALELAEPDGLVFPFLLVPAEALLERHPRHRTAHATLLSGLLDVLHGSAIPARVERPEAADELSETELRVLRYLPSNLSASEIAGELYVSTSTIKTHMRHIYDKLDAHRRTEAVERARQLGLLGPSAPVRR